MLTYIILDWVETAEAEKNTAALGVMMGLAARRVNGAVSLPRERGKADTQ
jgi:hypothetical protein